MKLLVFFILLIAYSWSFGQKKMVAHSRYYYDQNQLFTIDSTEYIYNTWKGSLNSFHPTLIFDLDRFILIPKIPELFCDTAKYYSGLNSSFSLINQDIYTIQNDQITGKLNSNGVRTQYSYNNLGLKSNVTRQIEISGIWRVIDSLNYNYDNQGNETNITKYIDFDLNDTNYTVNIELTDTILYDSNSNRIKNVIYGRILEIAPLELYLKTEFFYSNNILNHSNIYVGGIGSNLNWSFHDEYEFTNNQLVNYTHFPVNSGIPALNYEKRLEYIYNSNNQVSSYLNIESGDTGIVQLTYDSDNFLIKTVGQAYNLIGGTTIYGIRNYYFQSVAKLEELVDNSILIYPNPAANEFSIQSIGKIEMVQVLNISGQVILEQNSDLIDLTHLSSGTYIVRGSTDRGSFTEKIIKE